MRRRFSAGARLRRSNSEREPNPTGTGAFSGTASAGTLASGLGCTSAGSLERSSIGVTLPLVVAAVDSRWRRRR